MSGADMSLQVQSSSVLNEDLLPLCAESRAGSSSHLSMQEAAGSTVRCPGMRSSISRERTGYTEWNGGCATPPLPPCPH